VQEPAPVEVRQLFLVVGGRERREVGVLLVREALAESERADAEVGDGIRDEHSSLADVRARAGLRRQCRRRADGREREQRRPCRRNIRRDIAGPHAAQGTTVNGTD